MMYTHSSLTHYNQYMQHTDLCKHIFTVHAYLQLSASVDEEKRLEEGLHSAPRPIVPNKVKCTIQCDLYEVSEVAEGLSLISIKVKVTQDHHRHHRSEVYV